ncbi:MULTISPECIES: hypothetical protein [unclassified Variovorax]|uniref:hypothetical protein n=1 Tax=unclassified Variovorax TaxID=663243 RepID=UPI003ECDF07C
MNFSRPQEGWESRLCAIANDFARGYRQQPERRMAQGQAAMPLDRHPERTAHMRAANMYGSSQQLRSDAVTTTAGTNEHHPIKVNENLPTLHSARSTNFS